MKPTLDPKTLIVVARIINGDDALWPGHPASPWRDDEDIAKFARSFGLTYSAQMSMSGEESTAAWLSKLNDTEVLARIVEECVNPRHFARTKYPVERAVELINAQLTADGYKLIPKGKGYVLCESGRAVTVEVPPNRLSNEYVLEMESKCSSRLESGDLEGAITSARTLLEEVLTELERRLTTERVDHKGDLPAQWKSVLQMMHLVDTGNALDAPLDKTSKDLDARMKEIVRGLGSAVNGIARLRNKMSDSHAHERRPAPHHARLAVNAAKTIVDFLVASYEAQQRKDLK